MPVISKRALIALLCATAVLYVLITPAFDELPSTLPHYHGALFLALPIIPQVSESVLMPVRGIDLDIRALHSHDLQSLICTHLC